MHTHEELFSWKGLIRVVVTGLIVLLGWKALGVFPIILIAFVLAASFYPLVKKVEKKSHMPFILCIFLILIVPLVLIVFFGFSFLPKLVMQLPDLFASLNTTLSHLTFGPESLRSFDVIAYMQTHFDYSTTTINVAVTVFSVLTTIVLTFYVIYDFDRLLDLFLRVIPSSEKHNVKELMQEISIVVGKYIRGNVLISLICTVIIFIGLTLIHVPFALPLAIFAGIFDLLPLVGATLGAIPAIIIAGGVSSFALVLVIILYAAYQEVEKAIISPLIYDKALNLFPAISFLAVLLGGSLFGILGAFLALPIAASVPAVMNYRRKYKEHSAAL
jgi:predicted PurR-regulated permease PerM